MALNLRYSTTFENDEKYEINLIVLPDFLLLDNNMIKGCRPLAIKQLGATSLKRKLIINLNQINMKNNHILIVIGFAISVCLFSSCNKTNLTNPEAQVLIEKALGLPHGYREDVRVYEKHLYWPSKTQNTLVKQGFLDQRDHFDQWYTEYLVTEKAKPYCIQNDSKIAQFKTFDIAFNEVTGIAINKEQQTATVRFSVKATNITPIGQALFNNINEPKNGELSFKKFDNGWQLESSQNKSADDLLNGILGFKKDI